VVKSIFNKLIDFISIPFESIRGTSLFEPFFSSFLTTFGEALVEAVLAQGQAYSALGQHYILLKIPDQAMNGGFKGVTSAS